MDKTKSVDGGVREAGSGLEPGSMTAASSTDIVHVVDSQESQEEGQANMMAVLQDGSSRPLTEEEAAEFAYHESLEQRAAENESKLDEQRWALFRAQCLQDEEDDVMREAMTEDGDVPSRKRAKVRVVVEGEGGRIVRSEVFNLVVNEGESLTYKIMVLPKDDPEVSALRRQQQQRQQDEEGATSDASADTVPVDQHGHVLPEPAPVPEPELEAFMQTPEGEKYYKKWLKGDISSKMVRIRLGAGLLAKFHGRKVDEEENDKMVQEILRAEAEKKSGEGAGGQAMEEDNREPPKGGNEAVIIAGGALAPPTSWPSYRVASPVEGSSLGFAECMGDEEYNQYQLSLAVAAGDVPADENALESENGGSEANGEAVPGGEVALPEDGMVTTSTSTTETGPGSSERGSRQSDLRRWML